MPTLSPILGDCLLFRLGVDLFFAISGFLITTLIVREQASQRCILAAAFLHAAGTFESCRLF